MSNCKTPGSFFTIHIEPSGVSVDVDFADQIHLTEDQAVALENRLHDGVENALAPIFDICWQCGMSYNGSEDGCNECDA